jgi:hypothetical protein
MTDPTQRFTNRVDHYVKYRPSYPRAVLDLLETECGLTSASVVADVGSGTGILSELSLNKGSAVEGPLLDRVEAYSALVGILVVLGALVWQVRRE